MAHTREQVAAYIRANYLTQTDKNIAAALGIAPKTVRYLRRAEKLIKARSDFAALQLIAIQEYKDKRLVA